MKPSFYEVRNATGIFRMVTDVKPYGATLMPGDTVHPLGRIEPWGETRIRLAKKCNAILKANNLKPHHKRAKEVIHMFYVGALTAIDDEAQPWVVLCLITGRYDDLLKEN